MIFFFTYRKPIFLLVSCFLSLASLTAQSLLFPADYFFDVKRQTAILTDTTVIVHTSMQPFIYKEMPVEKLKKLKPGDDQFWDKVFFENLIQIKHIDKSSGYDRKLNLNINPILNYSYGMDSYDTVKRTIQTNTRGFWINGELGKNLRFETAFMENQSYFQNYLKDYSNATGVVPGQGRWKVFKHTGFDYAMSSGILHFQAGKNFSIRVGHGKQKVGNGYRSLLLSDNSFNYPYAQFTANFFKQKLQYSQTYAVLMNLNAGGTTTPPGIERLFQKKAATFQQLSWHTSKYLDVFVFQGTIWKATDSTNTMHLNPLYANPVIFTNLAAIPFNDVNHIITGGGFEVKPLKKTCLYAQFMYDGTSDSSTTNYAYQAGIKLFDAFKIKNLFLQYEYNYISQYAYINFKKPDQSYSHYNQALTTQALFPQEHIAMISYSYRKLFVQVKQNYAVGTIPGKTQFVSYLDGKIGLLINPNYNFTISVGATTRMYVNELVSTKPQQMQFIYVSLRTSLYNLYYDF